MKRIIIMGATSGIGLRVAEIYAMAGWRVGVAGRKDEVMTRLKSRFPSNIEWKHIDVNEKSSSTRLLELIYALGGMDIYLHASGICIENQTLVTDQETTTLETNVVGFARMIVTAFKYFRDRCGGVGQIAAVTSIAGTKGIGELASYSASKKFQQTYLEALEQYSRMNGIAVSFTDLRPGWTRTPLISPDRIYPMTMETDKVAAEIVKGIMRRTRVKVIDRRWAALYHLWNIIPSCIWTRIPLRVSFESVK